MFELRSLQVHVSSKLGRGLFTPFENWRKQVLQLWKRNVFLFDITLQLRFKACFDVFFHFQMFAPGDNGGLRAVEHLGPFLQHKLNTPRFSAPCPATMLLQGSAKQNVRGSAPQTDTTPSEWWAKLEERRINKWWKMQTMRVNWLLSISGSSWRQE